MRVTRREAPWDFAPCLGSPRFNAATWQHFAASAQFTLSRRQHAGARRPLAPGGLGQHRAAVGSPQLTVETCAVLTWEAGWPQPYESRLKVTPVLYHVPHSQGEFLEAPA